MKKFITVFQNRNFAKLFLANFTSQMGSTIGLTAFMFYLLDRFSDQPMYATITELMFSLPTLAVFFLVGVFADRMDRQKIAFSCDWICAFLSLLFLLVLAIGWMPLIFFILFLRSAVQKFFYPAEHAMVQGILKQEDYTTAAGLNQLVMSLFMLFGNGLGVLAYWTVGIYGAILIDALTFLTSAHLIRSCKISESVRMPNGRHRLKDLNISTVLADFRHSMKYLLQHRLLRTLLIGFIVFGIVNGGFSVMPVFILKYKLAPESYEEYSIVIGIMFGIGAILGSVIASVISQKMKLYQIIVVGLLITGSFVILSSLTTSIVLFFILVFMAALGLPFINIGIGGWMPKIVDPKMMGRVQGWISPLMMLSQSFTLAFIAYSFPSLIQVETLYWLVGGCLIIVGVFYAIALPKFGHNVESLPQAVTGS